MIQNNTSTLWLDNLRVIATVSVILLHVSTIPVIVEYELFKNGDSSLMNWHIGNIYDSAVRFCVPVFVMLSGALLIPKKISLQSFYEKRLRRIVIPFIFWALIYTIFNLILKIKHNEELTLFSVISLYITDLLQGPSFHFWYIYMIISVYLFIPIIAPWVNKASKAEIIFFLSIWFLTLIINQVNIIGYNQNFDLRYFSGYLGYLVLGYFLTYRLKESRSALNYGILLFLCGYTVTLVGTYISTTYNGKFSHIWYEYLTINISLMSIGVFLIIKEGGDNISNKYVVMLRDAVSKYGLGVYLVHVLVLHVLNFIGINYKFIYPLLAIPVTTLICLFISVVIIWALNKLPYGKYIFG